MRFLVLIGFMFVSQQTSAADKTLKFNDALIDQIHKDVQDDVNDKFQVKVPVGRGPASVDSTTEQAGQEDQKFNKMNVRQIGPNKW